jgi:hypothetical protein
MYKLVKVSTMFLFYLYTPKIKLDIRMSRLNILSHMFVRSPFILVQEHIAVAHKCSLALIPFFENVFKDSWDEALTIQQEIKELENKADQIKRKLKISLPNSLFLPVPRGDLLEIIRLQDKIANCAKDIAGLVIGRKMNIPIPIQDKFLSYVKRAVTSSAQALKAVSELDELLETGFQGREVKIVEKLIMEIDSIETETDNDQILIRRMMFEIEDSFPPINVMFIYKIIDWVGDLADRSSRVGSQLQQLLAS